MFLAFVVCISTVPFSEGCNREDIRSWKETLTHEGRESLTASIQRWELEVVCHGFLRYDISALLLGAEAGSQDPF